MYTAEHELNGFCSSCVVLNIGSVYLEQCPIQRFIPIYLIVAGAFGVFQTLFSAVSRVRNQLLHRTEQNAVPNPLSGLISLFLVAWLIAGTLNISTIWSFGNREYATF